MHVNQRLLNMPAIRATLSWNVAVYSPITIGKLLSVVAAAAQMAMTQVMHRANGMRWLVSARCNLDVRILLEMISSTYLQAVCDGD